MAYDLTSLQLASGWPLAITPTRESCMETEVHRCHSRGEEPYLGPRESAARPDEAQCWTSHHACYVMVEGAEANDYPSFGLALTLAERDQS